MPNITSKICHQLLCATSVDISVTSFIFPIRIQAAQRLAAQPQAASKASREAAVGWSGGLGAIRAG